MHPLPVYQVGMSCSLDGWSLKEELFQERRRHRLLQSSDPEEVQEGLKMVTPASLYEQSKESVKLVGDEDAEEAFTANSDAAESAPEDHAEEHHAAEDQAAEAPTAKAWMTPKSAKDIALWLPISFPPLPTKVSRLQKPPSSQQEPC